MFTRDWGTVWNAVRKDTHPPLYFLIMKLLTVIFGSSWRTIKILQTIPIFLLHLWSGILAVRDKKRIKELQTGILTVLFIFGTFFPFNIMTQNVEIRMYSWAMFFVTMSGIYVYKLMKQIKADTHVSRMDSILFILLTLAASLTHYYALFCEVFICLYLLVFILLLKKPFGERLALAAVLFLPIIIGYAWWLPFAHWQMLYSGDHISWIHFGISNIPTYLSRMIGFDLKHELLFIGLILIEVLYLLITCSKEEKDGLKTDIFAGILFFSMPYLLILTGTCISLLVIPFFYDRYLFPGLGLMWFGIILLLSRVKDRQLVYIGLLSGALLFLFAKNYPAMLEKEYGSGSSLTYEFISAQAEPGDVLITNNYQLGVNTLSEYLQASVLQFYFPDFPVIGMENFLYWLNDFSNTAWFFAEKDDIIDAEALAAHGFTSQKVFTGNIDSEYFFDIYKIYKIN